MISAATIELLVNAGVTGDELVRVTRSLECDARMFAQVTHSVREQSVTPGALRMRKMRETKKNTHEQETNNVTNSDANSDEQAPNHTYISSSKLDSSSKEERIMSESVTERTPVTRKRLAYSETFETFWKAYPTDPGMSKASAFKEFLKFSDDDQAAAIKSIPAFKAWIPKQAADYRTIHACNFLKQRRFDGFAEDAAVRELAAQQRSTQVYVRYGTDAGDAWEKACRIKGKMPPRDQNGGWWFPSEYPASEAA